MQHLSAWGRTYVIVVAALGALTVAQSALEIILNPVDWNWLILAVLTLLSGSATVKLPSVPATISISETFVFTSALLFGPAAGTLTVALDALVISLWLARLGHPAYRLIFNIFALPASLWVGAHLYYALGDVPILSTSDEPIKISRLLLPLTAFTVTYFLLNSSLIAVAISLERRLSPFKVWRDNFAWLSLNYFGGASIAALLVTYTRDIDYTYVAFILPLLAVLYFTFSVSMGRVEDANRHLSELNRLYMSTIETLAMAIDAKDQITHGHIRRVQQYAVGLAKTLGVKEHGQISAIEAASLLHDMGKLAVPEYILNKPGRLTPAEFEKMKLHASVGADILSAIDFPYPVVPIVRHHHENWDGSGYPDGLKGSEIPIGARILSVVDCFDALTSDRPYRPRLSDGDAIRILNERRGSMYDPLVVDTFVRVHAELAPAAEALPSTGSLSAITRGTAISEADTQANGSGLSDIAASTEEMIVLFDLAQGLSASLDVSDVGDLISKRLRRVIPASTTVFYLFDAATDELSVAHAAGEAAAHFAGLRIPRGQRLSGWVAANRQSILNSDPVLDLGEVARTHRPPLRSCLSTPLLSKDELIGVLSVYATQKDAFNENHRRIIEVIGGQVSNAIQRATAYEQTRAAKEVDPVSGLPNATALERVASGQSLGTSSAALSVIMIVLDQRKPETSGASEDSSSVATVARLVRPSLRGADLIFHLSASELVILLLRTDADSAFSIARRVAVELSPSRSPDARSIELIGIGVASAPPELPDIRALISLARDRAQCSDGLPDTRSSVH